MSDTSQIPRVQTEEHDGIRVLRLDRPPVNALNLELAEAAHAAIAQATADAKCTAVVLTGLPLRSAAHRSTRE